MKKKLLDQPNEMDNQRKYIIESRQACNEYVSDEIKEPRKPLSIIYKKNYRSKNSEEAKVSECVIKLSFSLNGQTPTGEYDYCSVLMPRAILESKKKTLTLESDSLFLFISSVWAKERVQQFDQLALRLLWTYDSKKKQLTYVCWAL